MEKQIQQTRTAFSAANKRLEEQWEVVAKAEDALEAAVAKFRKECKENIALIQANTDLKAIQNEYGVANDARKKAERTALNEQKAAERTATFIAGQKDIDSINR